MFSPKNQKFREGVQVPFLKKMLKENQKARERLENGFDETTGKQQERLQTIEKISLLCPSQKNATLQRCGCRHQGQAIDQQIDDSVQGSVLFCRSDIDHLVENHLHTEKQKEEQ